MGLLRKIAVFTVCAIAASLFGAQAARAETVDRIVANVNGDIILYSDLQEQLKVLAKYSPNLDLSDPVKRSQIERQVLNQMIQEKLADEEAKRLMVVVTNLEVEGVLTRMIQENHTTQAQLEGSLKANGQTIDKFKEQIKKDLQRNRLMERVLKSKIHITDQQIDDFLNSVRSGPATTSNRVHLGLIALPVDPQSGKPEAVEKTGREILDKLKHGADFQSMAKQYSKGHAAQDGGDIGYMAPEEIAPFIAKGIQGLKAGEVSELVQGPGGYYIIKVLDMDTRQLNPSDPGTREKAGKYLYDQEVNHRFDEWVRGLEAKAFIQISL